MCYSLKCQYVNNFKLSVYRAQDLKSNIFLREKKVETQNVSWGAPLKVFYLRTNCDRMCRGKDNWLLLFCSHPPCLSGNDLRNLLQISAAVTCLGRSFQLCDLSIVMINENICFATVPPCDTFVQKLSQNKGICQKGNHEYIIISKILELVEQCP